MRYGILLVLLWPGVALSAGPGDTKVRLNGWLGQTISYNQLSTNATDAFHGNNQLPVLGSGNDVRIGVTELGVGLRAHTAMGFGSHIMVRCTNSGVADPGLDIQFREAWLGYGQIANRFFLRVGQYTVPIGVEQPDSPNRWFASTGMIASALVPENMAGIFLGARAGRALQFRFWAGGPWNNKTYLLTAAPNLGVRANIQVAGQAEIGIYLQYGDADPGEKFMQRIVTGIDTYFAPIDALTLAAEFLLYAQRHDTAREAFYLYSWASMLLAGWDVQDWLRWVVRVEYVADDARNGVPNLFVVSQNGLEQSRAGYATALNFHIPANVILKIEGRYDHNSSRAFQISRQNRHGYWSANMQALYEFER